MASVTPRPPLSFHLHLSTPLKPNLHFPRSLSTPIKPRSRPRFTINSVDVSKEDTPPSDSSSSPPRLTVNSVDITIEDTPASDSSSSSPESTSQEKRRLEEKFAVLNTGIYECRSCGYKYDESVGDPSYPIPPGFQFQKLPIDWRCPTCGAATSFFQSKSVEIAGFAQNQQFGFGGNSLTSGQKTVLIYGSLLLFFALFLSGYFLQ